jgi:hypothetical protein
MSWSASPGHPRATSCLYVFEHIFVAEQLLGRHLLDGKRFIIETALEMTSPREPRASESKMCARAVANQSKVALFPFLANRDRGQGTRETIQRASNFRSPPTPRLGPLGLFRGRGGEHGKRCAFGVVEVSCLSTDPCE